MFSMRTKILAAFILVLALMSTAVGQETKASDVAPKSDNYVTEKGFRSRVFEIRYRDPDSLIGVIKPLGSGFKGATLAASRDFKTLTVRDFPENIAVIEEALKRLDTPEAPRADIELHIHVLIASSTENAAEQFPAELKDVLKQLQSTLNYKSYRLVASIINRVKEGPRGAGGDGITDLSAFTTASASRDIFATYSYHTGLVSLASSSAGVPVIQLNEFRFTLKTNAFTNFSFDTGVNTTTSVRDGEKVVIGTASLKDKGLILVLSAKVIK